jgi:hypothetical protein
VWRSVTSEALEGPRTHRGAVGGRACCCSTSAPSRWLRGVRNGRSLSLAADYLTFVGLILVVLLLRPTVFVGLDALGATFVRGVPFASARDRRLGRDRLGRGRDRYPRVRRIAGTSRRRDRGAASRGRTAARPGHLRRAASSSRCQLTFTLIALLSGYLAWRTFQGDIAQELEASNQSQRTLDGLLFASPNLLGFTAFFAGPLLFSLFVSLTEWDAFGEPTSSGSATTPRSWR